MGIVVCCKDSWLLVHGLPMEMMTVKNAERIGTKVGRLLRIEDLVQSRGIGRGFLRIRVMMDVQAPLVDGFWLPQEGNEKLWIQIQYEKLVDFCYTCGKIEHLLKNYGKDVQLLNNDRSKLRYRAHMKVIPVKGGSLGSFMVGTDENVLGRERSRMRSQQAMDEQAVGR
ncbi:hypothetical protein REPUB_Repub12eG0089100 [Reevesia pubescens]